MKTGKKPPPGGLWAEEKRKAADCARLTVLTHAFNVCYTRLTLGWTNIDQINGSAVNSALLPPWPPLSKHDPYNVNVCVSLWKWILRLTHCMFWLPPPPRCQRRFHWRWFRWLIPNWILGCVRTAHFQFSRPFFLSQMFQSIWISAKYGACTLRADLNT